MKSKSEIEQIKKVLVMMRQIGPPISFFIVLVVFMGVFGAAFWLSALIALLIAAAEYVTFSLMLNRWAGL